MSAGFVAGLLLGVAHWRMFLRNIQALHPAQVGRVRVLAGLASSLRVALTAAVGLGLVGWGQVDAWGLAAGMLASMYGFRVWAWRRTQEGTGRT